MLPRKDIVTNIEELIKSITNVVYLFQKQIYNFINFRDIKDVNDVEYIIDKLIKNSKEQMLLYFSSYNFSSVTSNHSLFGSSYIINSLPSDTITIAFGEYMIQKILNQLKDSGEINVGFQMNALKHSLLFVYFANNEIPIHFSLLDSDDTNFLARYFKNYCDSYYVQDVKIILSDKNGKQVYKHKCDLKIKFQYINENKIQISKIIFNKNIDVKVIVKQIQKRFDKLQRIHISFTHAEFYPQIKLMFFNKYKNIEYLPCSLLNEFKLYKTAYTIVMNYTDAKTVNETIKIIDNALGTLVSEISHANNFKLIYKAKYITDINDKEYRIYVGYDYNNSGRYQIHLPIHIYFNQVKEKAGRY